MKIVNSLTRALLGIAVIFAASTSHAEDFTIAGGGGVKTSTYSSMLFTLSQQCSTDDTAVKEVSTKGGIENLSLIKANKVKAAILPTDLLYAAKLENASSVANLQTLVALHPEEVHLIVRGDTKTEGGFNIAGRNFGGSAVSFTRPEDLKDRTVVAVGGSFKTAQILNDLMRYGWNVQEFKKPDGSNGNNTDMLAALTALKVDAVMIVAGAPSSAVTDLVKGNFRLLPIRGNGDTAAVYKPTKVQYDHLNSGRAVDTLAAQALLVSRTFRSEEMVKFLSSFRACVYAKLDTIKDADGSHPAWQNVSATDKGLWQWYELPKPATAQTPKKGK